MSSMAQAVDGKIRNAYIIINSHIERARELISYKAAARERLAGSCQVWRYAYGAVPVSVAVCGLLGALSAIRKVALKFPERLGANATLMLHVALTANVFPQVRDVMMNWPGLVPASPIELMFRIALPVLARTNVCEGLVVRRGTVPKFQDAGLSETPACMPVPVRVTNCGLVISESVMVSVPVRTPVVVGAKTTFTRQLLPGARLPPQLLLSEKFGLQEKPVKVSVVVPTFAIVTC
jgi:hypothetical protein